jgi:thiol-disulfide isomerase/thioredoxin/uncharacterized protein YuzE
MRSAALSKNSCISQLLVVLLLLANGAFAFADEKNILDIEDNEIQLKVYPAQGDVLLILLVDHIDHREMFEKMLLDIQQAGIEIWRADLVRDYFLPRTSESERTLSGQGVSAILNAAHHDTDKTIVLAAYDRLPLAVLRGANVWQHQFAGQSRLAGALLFYPNLFGPAPVAGHDPVLDPIVHSTNIPLVLYQPETGGMRWRLQETLEAFWAAGSPATGYLVPGVRDWFFMGGGTHGPGEKTATDRIPQEILSFAAIMNRFVKPQKAITHEAGAEETAARVLELVELKKPLKAPEFDLTTFDDNRIQLSRYRGKVTLVNFWASWCGPCVEEIPSLNALGSRFKGKDFEIVSIDYRETRSEIASFTQRIPVDFPILMDLDGKTSMNWKIFSFPSSFIVDRQGYVRYSANRAIDWDTAEIQQTIRQLLAEP